MKKNPINPKMYVDVQGKRIYVCCPGCITKIKAEPEKYIKQMEAEGIVLEKASAPKEERKAE
jgi:YHS domain-containing protein